MQKIGIIAAEVQEMEAVKEKMQNIKETKLYNSIFYEGTISNKVNTTGKAAIIVNAVAPRRVTLLRTLFT